LLIVLSGFHQTLLESDLGNWQKAISVPAPVKKIKNNECNLNGYSDRPTPMERAHSALKAQSPPRHIVAIETLLFSVSVRRDSFPTW
jgi:hypothetical protein